MMNRLLCGTLLLLAGWALPSQAQTVLLQDDFSDGDMDGWTVVDDPEPQSGPSNWLVRNGELIQTSNIWSYAPVELETKYHLGTHVVRGDAGWTDYSMSVVMRSSDNDGIGLLVRYQDAGNYVRLLLMNDPSWSGRDINGTPVNSALQRIEKFVDGEPVVLAENLVSSAWPTGYFTVTLDVRGNEFRAYLNGELILEAVDETFATGRVGLMSYANTGALFDDVLVTLEPHIAPPSDRTSVYPVLEDRLPYVQNPTQTSIELAWRTLEPVVGEVRIGSQKGEPAQVITEDEPRQKHHVRVDGLWPGTRYYYEVLNAGLPMAEEQSTNTAPENDASKVSFLIIGDSGVGNDIQQRVADQMLASMNGQQVDFAIHVGDVHQGSGDYYDDIYFKPYRDIISRINVFTVLGNHDTYTDNGAVYLDDFYLPSNNAEQSERYYSFRWGQAFFIALDTNISYAPDSPQYRFLTDALQSPERMDAQWTFVFAHHPPWTEYWTDYYGDEGVRQHLVPLFEEHGVDMVMNGHTHSYERGERGHVHYLVSGGGGGGLDSFFMDYNHVTFSAGVHHFTRIDIDGAEMSVTATDQHGNRIDHFLIHKQVSVGVEGSRLADVPETLIVEGPWPNPSSVGFQMTYEVAEPARVRVELFDVSGRKVAHLVDRVHPVGVHSVSVGDLGVPPGSYMVVLVAGNQTVTRSLVLIP